MMLLTQLKAGCNSEQVCSRGCSWVERLQGTKPPPSSVPLRAAFHTCFVVVTSHKARSVPFLKIPVSAARPPSSSFIESSSTFPVLRMKRPVLVPL